MRSFNLIQTKETYGSTLVELGNSNEDIFVVEADLMKASGSKPFMLKYPDRHINVGVAEQNLVSIAAGLAAMNRIPFACTMSNFISQRACDQVFLGASYNNLNVKLVGCYAGLSQEKNGGTHISFMDFAIMRILPNMKVIAPSDIKELKGVLIAVSKDIGPTYVHMPRVLPENIFDASYSFKIGKAYQIEDGKDLTLVSNGLTTHIAISSLELLKKENINASLLHIPTLKPIDREAIINCAKKTKAFLTIENHSIFGGLGGLISEIVSEEYPIPVFRIGINDAFGLTADLDFQLRYFGISAENILAKAKTLIKFKNKI
jgi:transketolase